jgi:hypothetical protein
VRCANPGPRGPTVGSGGGAVAGSGPRRDPPAHMRPPPRRQTRGQGAAAAPAGPQDRRHRDRAGRNPCSSACGRGAGYRAVRRLGAEADERLSESVRLAAVRHLHPRGATARLDRTPPTAASGHRAVVPPYNTPIR